MQENLRNSLSNDNETSHLDSGENGNFVQLEAYQEVSVAFKRNNVWSPGLIITSLFDSGSSKSFINEAIVPVTELSTPQPSGFRGIGNVNLQTLGTVQLKLSFRNETFIHNFYILPKSCMSLSIIVGRDLLSEFNITLAQFRKNYSKLMLMNLNKDKILNLKKPGFYHKFQTLGLLRSSIRAPLPEVYKDSELSDSNISSKFISISDKSEHKQQYDTTFSEMCSIDISDEVSTINVGEHLSKEQGIALRSIVSNNYINFPDKHIIPSAHKMRISLTHDTPIFTKPRRLSFDERNKVKVREKYNKTQ